MRIGPRLTPGNSKGRSSYLAAATLILGLGASCSSVRLTSPQKQSLSGTETFTGEVTRNPETDENNKDQIYRHVIYDEARKTNYYLDDHGKAETYDQKKVEIEGILEQKNTAIRVDSIKLLD